jgi:hypothetical protein
MRIAMRRRVVASTAPVAGPGKNSLNPDKIASDYERVYKEKPSVHSTEGFHII